MPGIGETRGLSFRSVKDLWNVAEDLPPTGIWRGKLLCKAWGKKACLHCFFEHLDSGALHVCTAYRSRKDTRIYGPRDEQVNFSEIGIEENVYELETGINPKGRPAWYTARPID